MERNQEMAAQHTEQVIANDGKLTQSEAPSNASFKWSEFHAYIMQWKNFKVGCWGCWTDCA